jgi:hypothetical protein
LPLTPSRWPTANNIVEPPLHTTSWSRPEYKILNNLPQSSLNTLEQLNRWTISSANS